MPVLELRHVTKRFGGLTAVDDVTFGVEEGELLGIAGPNGSGKSTLFNVVTGIPFGASSGEILFDGKPITRMVSHRIARLGLARTFQKDAEYPDLTAKETIALAAIYGRGLNRHAAAEAAETQLEAAGIGCARAGMLTTALSVYERKQLMIASALVMQPKVLMLDEPASGLTRPEIAALNAHLVKINKGGVTILLIEHVLSLLLSLAERLIVLNQGAVLAEGDPQEVIRDERVIEAYLGGRSA